MTGAFGAMTRLEIWWIEQAIGRITSVGLHDLTLWRPRSSSYMVRYHLGVSMQEDGSTLFVIIASSGPDARGLASAVH